MPDDKQFDVEGARKAGYSDDDIIQHLSQSRKFDVAGAQKAGYSSQEIIDHLSGLPSTPTAPAPAAPSGPDSFLGGFGRRALDTAKGMISTLNPVTSGTGEEIASAVGGPGGLALYRTGKGIAQGYQQKAADLAQNVAGGNYGKAALNVAQLAPGSPIGPASPTGSLVDTAAEGRYREALGGGAFDALTMLLGAKMGKAPSTRSRVGSLTSAVGKTGETGEILQKVLPDLDNVVQQVGAKPETLGDLRHTTQTAIDGHEGVFNQALAGVQNQLVDTSAIRQKILGLIKADSSPEEQAAIHNAANEYLQPKTMQWLNDRRGRLNASSAPIFNKTSRAAASQMKSDLDMAIDRTARNAVADLEYDVMNRAYPGKDFGQMKSQVSSLWKLKDMLDDRIGNLTDAQLEHETKKIWDRIRPSAYASATGIHGYLGGMADNFSLGPQIEKNMMVHKAFNKPQLARAVVLASPLSRLFSDKDQSQRPGGLTPPPQP